MSSIKRTMTLNLTDAEMSALEELCVKKDLSKTSLLRQALRLYQLVGLERDKIKGAVRTDVVVVGGVADEVMVMYLGLEMEHAATDELFDNPLHPYTEALLSSIPLADPDSHPNRIQLYSFPTPNGIKISAMLEETGIAYEPHLVNILKNETWTPEFLALNPNGKIPAIIDPNGTGGQPLALFESGAILVYLAEKSGKLLSSDPATRYETLQWMFFQVGHIGPMFGEVGFFHKFAGREYEDKRPRDRYAAESSRLLAVLDARLTDRAWIMGDDYSIADISLLGWVRNLIGFYEAAEIVGFDRFSQVQRWLDAGLMRPAVQRGLTVTAA